MGKKRRYRSKLQKFGVKYALKYGISSNTEAPIEVSEPTPEPSIAAAPEIAAEELVVVEPKPAKVTITAEPAAKPSKRKAAPKKSATTTRKTTRKRTTKAKTTT
jgi:hypothetical protein